MNASSLVVDLLRRGGFKSGLANCHIPGLFSLVLEDRKSDAEGMLRIFYAGPECTDMEAFITDAERREFSLLPHNHRQDITLYGLFGDACNYDVEVKGGGPSYEWGFGSAIINGNFTLERNRSVSLNVVDTRIRPSGTHLTADRVHTVTASPESAWLVVEGALSGAVTTQCYSIQPDARLSSEGLYIALSQERLQELGALIAERVTE